MKTATIRDAIYKDIELDEVKLKILDTPEMQRLRRIKQNGLCYLVYPCMNNTRFEHCIGVMHLAEKVAEKLNLEQDEKEDIEIAGLLHDIGHLPFSHLSELTQKYIKNFSHEQNSVRIIKGEENSMWLNNIKKYSTIKEILNAYGINVNKICDLIMGKGTFGKIINSDIDVDRMDYLLRDSYYAGVAYGIIDVNRLIQCLKFNKNLLTVTIDGLEAVENLLIARNLMYQTVYRHHTKRIAESMFSRAYEIFLQEISKNLSNKEIIEKLSIIDDYQLENLMENSKHDYVNEIIKRIRIRDLFKRVYVEKYINIADKLENSLCTEIEDKICNSLEIQKNYLLVDIPKLEIGEYDVLIEHDGVLSNIEEVSELAKALKKQEIERLNFCIYVDKKYLDRAKNFIPGKFINLKQRRLIY